MNTCLEKKKTLCRANTENCFSLRNYKLLAAFYLPEHIEIQNYLYLKLPNKPEI